MRLWTGYADGFEFIRFHAQNQIALATHTDAGRSIYREQLPEALGACLGRSTRPTTVLARDRLGGDDDGKAGRRVSLGPWMALPK